MRAALIAERAPRLDLAPAHRRYVAKDPENKHLRRKALIAVAAKMARVAEAIVRSGADYRPFFEQPVPSGRTSLC